MTLGIYETYQKYEVSLTFENQSVNFPQLQNKREESYE